MNSLRHSFFACALLLLAGTVHAEQITDFSAEYVVRTDGTVDVVETIKYDFGSNQQHGIFRTLGTEHPQPATNWYTKRSIGIEVTSVEQNDTAATYEVDDNSSATEVKIGDPDRYVTGTQTYTISYKLTGALAYGESGAEFYYDVTGNGWSVPILSTRATVRGEGVGMLADRSVCYVGGVGSTDRCQDVGRDGTQTMFIENRLAPYEGLTIAQELNPETVAVLINEQVIAWPIFVAVFMLYVIAGSVYVYIFRDMHDPEATVIAQYEPYPGVLPMYTGLLIDGSLDPKDVTAGLVYLAEQGFLKIKRVEEKVFGIFNSEDYELTLLRPKTEAANPFLEQVLTLLFSKNTVGETLRLKELKKDQGKQRVNSATLMSMKSALAKDLVEQSFYEQMFGKMYVNLSIGALVVVLSGWFILGNELVWVVAIATGVLLALFMVLGRRRRTKKGFEARNHLLGFKEFLSVTDKERFKFHNAPEKSSEQFMAFLPYAIAFGVEKQWAEVFRDISIPNPSWYDGGSTHAFSAAAFSSDIGSFSSSFSASSGTSGSSGGGSSGGGGGGGGGGSW